MQAAPPAGENSSRFACGHVPWLVFLCTYIAVTQLFIPWQILRSAASFVPLLWPHDQPHTQKKKEKKKKRERLKVLCSTLCSRIEARMYVCMYGIYHICDCSRWKG